MKNLNRSKIRYERTQRQKIRNARHLASEGELIVPLKPTSKTPAYVGWQEKLLKTPDQVQEFFIRNPDHNYGVLAGGQTDLLVLDVDGPKGDASLQKLARTHGPLPQTLKINTHRGYHLYLRGGGKIIRNSTGKLLGAGVDVRGQGGYVVGPGSRHPEGGSYRVDKFHALFPLSIAPAPKWLMNLLTLASTTERQKSSKASGRLASFARAEAQKVAAAPKGSRNDQLNRSAFAVGQAVGPGYKKGPRLRETLALAALASGLAEAEIDATIESGFNAGTRDARALTAPFAEGAADALAETLSNLGETDTDNAKRLITRYGELVRHAPGVGWLLYDGKRWAPDKLEQRRRLATDTAVKIAGEARFLKLPADQTRRLRFCESSKSAGAIDRMLTLAQHQLAIEDSALDRDPGLLNTPTGTIELKLGKLRPHRSADFITKMLDVAYDPAAKCPRFKAFLHTITGGDKDFVSYLRRTVGYCLTGLITEQKFFFVYGQGRNGKSTFVNIIRDMLGEYGRHTPTETLLVKQYDNAIPADLARLKGARMVTAAEANFNRPIDEAKIKAMTGGELITARYMRQDFFSFLPEFKLWLVANDFPRVRGTAEAFWRRVQVLPFEADIPEDQIDLNLTKKLVAEMPGILAWAVRGCLDWQKQGLGECKAVSDGTARWRGFADHVGRFISDACTLDQEAKTAASQLMASYKAWCLQHGEKPMTPSGFTTKLKELDLTHRKTKTHREWSGIGLKG